MADRPETTLAVRVVRLAPWLLEVVQERPGKPWDAALGNYEKRRDAERAAKEAAPWAQQHPSA